MVYLNLNRVKIMSKTNKTYASYPIYETSIF